LQYRSVDAFRVHAPTAHGDQEAVRDVLADVASDIADKIKECTPCYFPVLAADPSGFYLAFAPELFAADPSVN